MDNIEKILYKFEEKLDQKFDQLNKKISTLQDFVLYMKADFDLISKSKMENESLTELTSITETNLNHFLDKRPQICKSLDRCTTLIERCTLKTLRVYMKKGPKFALKLLDSYTKISLKFVETGRCSDSKCMDNAVQIFKTLTGTINSSDRKALKSNKALFSKLMEYNSAKKNEKEECKLLTPISNEIRLKILKILGKGGTYYSQLERQVGLKGGHFQFHLDKLVEASYVSREGEKGPYSITTNGLKVLKFLFDLRQDLALI